MRSWTAETLQEITMRSPGRPMSWAKRALSSAETMSASRITSSASFGDARRALSSIIRARSSGSSDPQLTPMRTGLPCSIAFSTRIENCSSRFEPWPTLPGLMRYLSSTTPHSGTCVSSLWPLKWKSPTSGTFTPIASRRRRISGTWRAASTVFTVMRTISEPARASCATWSAVDFASSVSVLVMDCTRMGAPPPITLSATWTAREGRRGRFILEFDGAWRPRKLFDGDARDGVAHVGLEVQLAIVEEKAHIRRVAHHDLERGPAAHFGLAPGVVEAREQDPSAGVAHLDPGLALEAQLDHAARIPRRHRHDDRRFGFGRRGRWFRLRHLRRVDRRGRFHRRRLRRCGGRGSERWSGRGRRLGGLGRNRRRHRSGGTGAGAGDFAAGGRVMETDVASAPLRTTDVCGAERTNTHQYIAAKPSTIASAASPAAFTYGLDKRSEIGSKRMFWLGTSMRGTGCSGAASARRVRRSSAGSASTLA